MSSILSRPDHGTQAYSVSSPSDENLSMEGYAACVIYSSRDQSLLPFRYHMLALAEFSSWKVHDDRGRGVNLCPDYSVKAMCLDNSAQCYSQTQASRSVYSQVS
jgi:hypothetical protein